MKSSNDTVYCDVQMSGTQGVELLKLVTKLRESGDHPGLDKVFQSMETELQGSIECLAKGGADGSWKEWLDQIDVDTP